MRTEPSHPHHPRPHAETRLRTAADSRSGSASGTSSGSVSASGVGSPYGVLVVMCVGYFLVLLAATPFPSGGPRRAIGGGPGSGAWRCRPGPLLGGLLIDAVGWRAVFLVDGPVVVAAAVATVLVVEPGRARREMPVDGRGAGLGVLVLVCATYA